MSVVRVLWGQRGRAVAALDGAAAERDGLVGPAHQQQPDRHLLLGPGALVLPLRLVGLGGLENEVVAEVLGVPLATVKRDWTLARAWLARELAAR